MQFNNLILLSHTHLRKGVELVPRQSTGDVFSSGFDEANFFSFHFAFILLTLVDVVGRRVMQDSKVSKKI